MCEAHRLALQACVLEACRLSSQADVTHSLQRCRQAAAARQGPGDVQAPVLPHQTESVHVQSRGAPRPALAAGTRTALQTAGRRRPTARAGTALRTVPKAAQSLRMQAAVSWRLPCWTALGEASSPDLPGSRTISEASSAGSMLAGIPRCLAGQPAADWPGAAGEARGQNNPGQADARGAGALECCSSRSRRVEGCSASTDTAPGAAELVVGRPAMTRSCGSMGPVAGSTSCPCAHSQ